MTTIAYRDGVMAADSRATSGMIHRGEVSKIVRLNDGGLFGFCGVTGWMEPIVDWLNGGPKPDVGEDDTGGILVRPGGIVSTLNPKLLLVSLEAEFYACGSGNELAIGAMAMGASARRAVEVACLFDIYSAAPVITRAL